VSNEKKVIDLKPTTRAAIVEGTKQFFDAENSKRSQLAHLLGMAWSEKSMRYVRADHAPIMKPDDFYASKGNPQKYAAVREGYIIANDKRFGKTFDGFTLAEISLMTTDDVKEHKLQLADGNKKPQTKAQTAKVERFKDAQESARNKISTGIADLRDTVNVILAKPSRKSESAKSKAPTLPQPDTASGTDSTTRNVVDVEIESGTATEAKGSVVPFAIQHPILIEVVNKLAQFDIGQQAVVAESDTLQALLDGLNRALKANHKTKK